MKPGLFALMSFFSNENSTHIYVKTDITRVVAYILHFGDSKSEPLNLLVRETWLWCSSQSCICSELHAHAQNCPKGPFFFLFPKITKLLVKPPVILQSQSDLHMYMYFPSHSEIHPTHFRIVCDSWHAFCPANSWTVGSSKNSCQCHHGILETVHT